MAFDLGRDPRDHRVRFHRWIPDCEELDTDGVAPVIAHGRVVVVDIRLRDAAGKKKRNNEQAESEKTVHGTLRVKDLRRPETAQRSS